LKVGLLGLVSASTLSLERNVMFEIVRAWLDFW
jgi:hypothetical protein